MPGPGEQGPHGWWVVRSARRRSQGLPVFVARCPSCPLTEELTLAQMGRNRHGCFQCRWRRQELRRETYRARTRRGRTHPRRKYGPGVFDKVTVLADGERRAASRLVYYRCLCDRGRSHVWNRYQINRYRQTGCVVCRRRDRVDPTDKQVLDWIEAHPDNAPHRGESGRWYVTAHAGREVWGAGATLREAVAQAMAGTGPDKPDRDA